MAQFTIRLLNIINLIFGGFLVAILGLGVAGFFDEYSRATASAEESSKLARDLDGFRRDREIALVVNELAALKREVQGVRSEGEEAGKRQEQTISALEEKVEENVRTAASYDIAPVVEEWRKSIASVSCRWLTASGRVATEYRGSGIAAEDTRAAGGSRDPAFGIVTSKHLVVDDKGDAANYCVVRLPGNSATYTVRSEEYSIAVSPTSDRAFLVMRNPDAAFRRAVVRSYCAADPVSGDRIVILGYPLIGSSGDVTATEGIISGFEGEYYITSAKIEQGNSGGAALLLKDNCYLGIPSFVRSGGLESLGRILRHAAIR